MSAVPQKPGDRTAVLRQRGDLGSLPPETPQERRRIHPGAHREHGEEKRRKRGIPIEFVNPVVFFSPPVLSVYSVVNPVPLGLPLCVLCVLCGESSSHADKPT